MKPMERDLLLFLPMVQVEITYHGGSRYRTSPDLTHAFSMTIEVLEKRTMRFPR